LLQGKIDLKRQSIQLDALLFCYLNVFEYFSPNRTADPFRWIPEGIYFDLFDARNEATLVIDDVTGYTNQQFFNALDNDIRSIPQFRTRLLIENSNNQAASVNALFGQYNY